MPDSNCRGWQAVHFEQEATGQFTCRWITCHISWDITVEHLTRRVHVFADLHLEWNVPDMVQAERYQRTFNNAVNTECHNRVLICRPLGEGLDCAADWRPDEGQNHTHDDRSQTRDDRHETFTCEEAQIFRQLNAVEAVEHIGRNGTSNNAAQNTGIRKV